MTEDLRLNNTFPPRPISASLPQKNDEFTFSERLYSAREVAERLGVSERWVRDHATRRNPRIRAVKLGPLLRFREADVADFIAKQTADISKSRRTPNELH
jgi:excisionase family DNA binding protein